MPVKSVSITITEAELCRHFKLKQVSTAIWIGAKGNRKLVIRGIKV